MLKNVPIYIGTSRRFSKREGAPTARVVDMIREWAREKMIKE